MAVRLVRQGFVAEAVDLVRAPVDARAAVERELDAVFWQRFSGQGRGRTSPRSGSGR
ncbi:hypothetical protein GCM10009827_009970 [Dactylosporangium maewongense]|uniref:Uncharacterized protein n=1 Tax=Dactylosporangium maewongense TaxID=634393 RepID=A0ABP4KH45_9ACTN